MADLTQLQSPLWTPSKEQVEGANITAFMRAAAAAWNVDLPDYAALYKWSIRHPDQFWQLLWDFTGVIASHRGDTIIENRHSMFEFSMQDKCRASVHCLWLNVVLQIYSVGIDLLYSAVILQCIIHTVIHDTMKHV